MKDLHTPLGDKTRSGSWKFGRLIGIGLAALFLVLSVYGYWIGREDASPTRVAIKDAKVGVQTQPSAIPDQPQTAPAETGPAPEAPPSTSETRSSPAQDQPVFQPQKSNAPSRPAWVFVPELAEESDFGVLPKVSPTGLRPLDAYSSSPSTIGSVRIAIVLGGLGISQSGTKKAIDDLPSSVTLAFSPIGNSLNRWMQVARKQGHEVALQLPMEPIGYPAIDPGRLTLLSGSDVDENKKQLLRSLGRMTNYPVVLNYLGGNFMNKREAIEPILRELRDRGLGFLDDGTIASSIAPDLAEELKLPNAIGNVVLDGSRDPRAIDNQLKSLELFARRRGFAIATGSVFPETIKQVREFVRDAEKRGIQIVPLSNLIRDYPR